MQAMPQEKRRCAIQPHLIVAERLLHGREYRAWTYTAAVKVRCATITQIPRMLLVFPSCHSVLEPSYSPTWGSPRYPCGFRGVTLSSGAFLCGARCLLHIRKLETHAGTDIRESNPTHRVLETPSPPWNICPHICPADIPAGAERSPSCYLRAAACVIKEKGCLSITRTQFDYMLSAPKSQ